MEIYQIKDLVFTYPDHDHPTLNHVTFNIERGAFVTICGPSGCGKTTLLRHLKPSTAPHGSKCGEIFFEQTELEKLSPREAATKIGFVFQSPENQIVTDTVWHELAFGLESIGLQTSEIRLRVAEMASFFGIQTWFHKPVTELSGGQKQLLALASIMALQPDVLILDEPTSKLDPIAASEFLAAVGKINRDLGVTVILTEHRLEEAFPLSTRVITMDDGQIIADGTPEEVGHQLRGAEHGMFLAMPTPMRVWAAVQDQFTIDECPVTVRDGRRWLDRLFIEKPDHFTKSRNVHMASPHPAKKTAVRLQDVWFKYEKHLPDVIKGLSFEANYGEITAILGGNGTGKTTTLGLMSEMNTPYRGKIDADATVYALPQNPQSIFVAKSVREDLEEILSEHRLSKPEKAQRLAAMVKLCRLDGLLERHPYDLSGGEQQRAALAKVLLLQPKILLLDEPTKGLDAEFKQIFAAILKKLAEGGVAVILVSHDIEFCAEHSDRCALFFDGNIIAEDSPRSFFSGNSFYTTSANRMSRELLPDAITANDLILAVGGQLPEEPEILDMDATYEIPPDLPPSPTPPKRKVKKQTTTFQQTKLTKRTIAAAAMILLTIPLTIYLGIHIFEDRRFYFISMLVVLQTMLPFALIFESRKPQARELVIIAVLCAIAVAGRVAFFMLPQFSPVVALVIIAGVAFGGESGFLVGSMAFFVSNMFFGQGPWTPWQMFASGIIGFLAGILSRKGLLRRTPASLAVFGGFATFFIYGGIMNTASVLMWQPNPTWQLLIAYYLQGMPMDLIHALSTILFLALASRPMLEKLDRIQVKYGLVDVEV